MENEIKKKNYTSWIVPFIVAVGLMTIGGVITFGILSALPGTTVINKSEKEVTVNENGIADAVEKVYDSVVIVEVYKNNKLYGTGSGFIFKKDGNKYYVMTNNHVVEDATSVKIVMSNDKTYQTTLVGTDKYLDIAVLSFESEDDISVAEVGSSENTRVGDTVFTVGAPIDSSVYSWTVTRGVLSGKNRLVSVSTSSNSSTADYIRSALQTDANINSGNSGGPLCNSNGQVIGITNMKLSTTSSSNVASIEGMSFAIPIDDAMEYANKLINGEDVSRPYIGISMAELTQSLYAYYYYGISVPSDVDKGVLVIGVEEGSPASKAGLKKGDIITKVNGTEVSSVAELKYELYKHSVGETVSITVNRNGNSTDIKVTLSKNS